jgi:adenylate cyclase
MALGAVDGYGAPEVYEAYRGARELCRDTFDWLHLVPIVIGLWSFHASRGEFDQAQRLGSELLAMADEADAPGLLARGHVMHGGALAHLGYLPEARIELEQARAESDAHADSCPFILDVRVHTLCERSELLAVMGYVDQALSSAQEALALAHRLDSPYNITFAVFFCSVIRRRRGEAVEALKSADAAIEQALRHGFLDALSWATGLRSWALCHSGRSAEGISAIDGALASTRRMGPNVARAPLLAILADAYLSARRPADGLAAIEEASVAERGDRYCLSELSRLRGDLLRLRGDVSLRRKAEACYLRAIKVAKSQDARLFELLATTRLCDLRSEARRGHTPWRALTTLYDSFTEGWSTPVLSDARKLLKSV